MIPILVDPAERLIAAHAAASPFIAAAREKYGEGPPMTVDEWVHAPVDVQLASLLTLALAWLVTDPVGTHRAAMSAASSDVAGAYDWTRQAGEPSHAELARRRDWNRRAREQGAA